MDMIWRFLSFLLDNPLSFVLLISYGEFFNFLDYNSVCFIPSLDLTFLLFGELKGKTFSEGVF